MASGGEDPASGLFNIRANYPSSAAKLTGLGSSRHAGCAIVRCCCFGLERTKPARLSPPFARSGPFPRGKPSTGQAREFPPNQTDDVPHSHLPACKGRHCAVTCHLRSITDSYSRPSKNVKSSNLVAQRNRIAQAAHALGEVHAERNPLGKRRKRTPAPFATRPAVKSRYAIAPHCNPSSAGTRRWSRAEGLVQITAPKTPLLALRCPATVEASRRPGSPAFICQKHRER